MSDSCRVAAYSIHRPRFSAIGASREWGGAHFWRSIQEGRVPLPCCPATAEDAYAAYLVWCWRYGHSAPDPLKLFVAEFMRAAGLRRFTPRIFDDQGAVQSRRRVLLMGKVLRELWAERHRVVSGVAAFRRAVQAYSRSPTGISECAAHGNGKGAVDVHGEGSVDVQVFAG